MLFIPSKCREITRKLLEHPSSKSFSHPIDPENDAVPDYFDIVKNPMDLSTIMDKIDSGRYQTVSQWFNDVELVWNNSILYNGETSYIALTSNFLRDIFYKETSKAGLAPYQVWLQTCQVYYRSLSKQMKDNIPKAGSRVKGRGDNYGSQNFSQTMNEIADAGDITDQTQVLQLLQILSQNGYTPDTKKEKLNIDLKRLSPEAVSSIYTYMKESKPRKMK